MWRWIRFQRIPARPISKLPGASRRGLLQQLICRHTLSQCLPPVRFSMRRGVEAFCGTYQGNVVAILRPEVGTTRFLLVQRRKLHYGLTDKAQGPYSWRWGRDDVAEVNRNGKCWCGWSCHNIPGRSPSPALCRMVEFALNPPSNGTLIFVKTIWLG